MASTIAAAHPPTWTLATRPVELSQAFQDLAREWREQSKYMSDTRRMSLLPSYQRIIGMGPAVLPLILAELERNGGHWFWALEAITGEDPVPAEERGRIPKMAAAWLDWGRRHGQIG